MKKILLTCLFAFAVLGSTALADSEAGVEFNSMEVEFDRSAIISQNRVLVPMRKIFELLGAEVSWDDATRTAVSTRFGKTVTVTVGKAQMYVDGEEKELDVAARIVDNRTLIPLRAVSEAYECNVLWDESERCAKIYTFEFLGAQKEAYEGALGLGFEYFADTALSEKDGAVSITSGACSMTVTAEADSSIAVDGRYAEYILKGLKSFGGIEIKQVKQLPDKNAVYISCYNNGNSIYYLYANSGGVSYHAAVTVPDGAQRYDAEKLMYVQKSLMARL